MLIVDDVKILCRFGPLRVYVPAHCLSLLSVTYLLSLSPVHCCRHGDLVNSHDFVIIVARKITDMSPSISAENDNVLIFEAEVADVLS